MSWQDDIETIVFTIITGDGKTYTPKWLNAQKSREYNSSVFEFVNVDGSLVLRQRPKGRTFDLEFYFDGENAVQEGNNFESSANNPKPWTVKHPFYGNILCQPISLKQDNSQYNVSKFTVPVMETISEKYPQISPIIGDVINSSVVSTNEVQLNAVDESGQLNKTELKDNVNFLDRTYSKIIKTNDELVEFKKLVSETIVEIENSSSTALSVLRYIQALINFPATIDQTVDERINIFIETISGIYDSLDGSLESKFRYEGLAGAMIGAILISSSSNITDDYETRSKVIAIQDKIIGAYNDFMSILDSFQTDRADSDNSYTPVFNAQNSLNLAVQYTISNLFEIAFSAKQEREYTLDKDSNAILLTHRFYGLDSDDVNLKKFISTNNIGLNEILGIKKGRKIIYYV